MTQEWIKIVPFPWRIILCRSSGTDQWNPNTYLANKTSALWSHKPSPPWFSTTDERAPLLNKSSMTVCPFLAFSKAKDLKHFLLFQELSPRHWSMLCEAKRDRYQHNSFLLPKLETCRVGFSQEMRRDEEVCTWDRPRRGDVIWHVGSNDPVRCLGFLHDGRHAFRQVEADLISRKVHSVCRAQDKYLEDKEKVKKKVDSSRTNQMNNQEQFDASLVLNSTRRPFTWHLTPKNEPIAAIKQFFLPFGLFRSEALQAYLSRAEHVRARIIFPFKIHSFILKLTVDMTSSIL